MQEATGVGARRGLHRVRRRAAGRRRATSRRRALRARDRAAAAPAGPLRLRVLPGRARAGTPPPDWVRAGLAALPAAMAAGDSARAHGRARRRRPRRGGPAGRAARASASTRSSSTTSASSSASPRCAGARGELPTARQRGGGATRPRRPGHALRRLLGPPVKGQRRGRDSNPRTRLTPVTRFPVVPVQPLRHLSWKAGVSLASSQIRHSPLDEHRHALALGGDAGDRHLAASRS